MNEFIGTAEFTCGRCGIPMYASGFCASCMREIEAETERLAERDAREPFFGGGWDDDDFGDDYNDREV